MSFLVGLLIGLTSMGGAALMAPFLILVLGMKPTVAVQTDLIYGSITKIVAAWMHWRQKTVDLHAAMRLAYGSIPGGLLGSAATYILPRLGLDAEQYTKRAIGLALVVVAIVLLTRLFSPPPAPSASLRRRWVQGPGTIIWGALVGFCVGLTSVGSGSLVAPFLLLALPLSAATVVGTDVFHAALLVTVTASAHAFAGPIQWSTVCNLVAGAVPGAMIGSHLVPRIPARALRGGMAVVLLGTGLRMV